jgi:hypothetical protein
MFVNVTDSLTECVDNCSVFENCVAATWVEGTCYLKNNNTEVIYNSWVDSKSPTLWLMIWANGHTHQVPTSVLRSCTRPTTASSRHPRLVALSTC